MYLKDIIFISIELAACRTPFQSLISIYPLAQLNIVLNLISGNTLLQTSTLMIHINFITFVHVAPVCLSIFLSTMTIFNLDTNLVYCSLFTSCII